jgi:hypothetical protein
MHQLLSVNFASMMGHLTNPAYMDIIKIFAGSILWIGGLTLFMWWRERNKPSARA